MVEIIAGISFYLFIGFFITIACIRFGIVKKHNTGVPLFLWPICLLAFVGFGIALLVTVIIGLTLSFILGAVGKSRVGDWMWRLGGGSNPNDG